MGRSRQVVIDGAVVGTESELDMLAVVDDLCHEDAGGWTTAGDVAGHLGLSEIWAYQRLSRFCMYGWLEASAGRYGLTDRGAYISRTYREEVYGEVRAALGAPFAASTPAPSARQTKGTA